MEYAGYQASTPIDWSKLTGGLVKTIQDIGADREKKRQDLDKLAEDNIKVLQNAELGKSQNVQDLTLQGSSYGRDKIVMWNRMLKNGQLNPVEYRRNINNLNGTWTTFANAAKTFDAQLEELQKRQIPGEDGFIPGDKFEAYKSLKLAQLADLKGKRMEVDSNGNFLMVKENPDGTYDPENVVDFRSAFKPNNFRSDNINLSKVLDIQTKNIADVVKESGATTITDALQLPAVVSTISNVKGAILSNPRQAAAVLTNNSSGNYDYYSNKDEYNANIQNRIDKENDYRKISGKEKLTTDEVENFVKDQKKFMILVQADDQGVDQPVLDKDQYEVAGKVIEDGFKARLDYKKELDEPNYGGSGSGGSGAKDQAKQADENATMLAGYKATLRAWGADPEATISSGKWVKSPEGSDFGGLRAGYNYTSKNGGIEVKRGRDVVFFAKTPKDLAQFVYNSEPAKASLKWEEARKLVGGNRVESTTNDPLGLGL
jgi:hypothetical protein